MSDADDRAAGREAPASMGRFEAGMAVRRRVLGDEHVDRSMADATSFDEGFQRWITEVAWGSVWSDDTLDDRTRSMVTVAILAALGRPELDLHLRATTNTGVTPDEIAEVLRHVGVYAGIPAANHAMGRAKALLTASEDDS